MLLGIHIASTCADVDATIGMLLELKKAAPRLRLTFGCSTFVPKAHTPFQVGCLLLSFATGSTRTCRVDVMLLVARGCFPGKALQLYKEQKVNIVIHLFTLVKICLEI